MTPNTFLHRSTQRANNLSIILCANTLYVQSPPQIEDKHVISHWQSQADRFNNWPNSVYNLALAIAVRLFLADVRPQVDREWQPARSGQRAKVNQRWPKSSVNFS